MALRIRHTAVLLLGLVLVAVVACGGTEPEPVTVATEIPTQTASKVKSEPTVTAIPEPTDTPTEVPLTLTPAPVATATFIPEPTPTEVPPTPTPTQVPPTATPTQVPPTATPTQVPPTATATPTQVPPTATATATPTPTPTPIPTITAKERLISIGYNVPKRGSLSELNHEFVGGLNLAPGYKERFVEIQNSINSVLGGYPNYVYLAFDPNGTDEDAKPLFERLSELKFWDESKPRTIEELNKRKTCLGGANPGGGLRTATTNPHSICLESLEKIYAYSYKSGPPTPENYGKLAIHYAHEYFHHYQRAHALDRGLDQQYDTENPETTVQAPRWWIEGAAVSFQNAWYQSNWESLSFLKGQNVGDASNGDLATASYYKHLKQLVRGVLPESEMRGACTSDWSMSASAESSLKCSASLAAVAYMAHLTSWKTVWIDITQDYYDLGFWGSFEKHMGMTNEEFYDAFNKFLKSGDIDDDPPEGWTLPDGPISAYADFWKIVPESD